MASEGLLVVIAQHESIPSHMRIVAIQTVFHPRILEEKFMKFQHRHNVIFSSEPAELIKELQNFVPLAVDEKWINDLKQKKTY